MIKTIINSNVEQLDKDTNAFIKTLSTKSAPVRTECYVLNNQVFHKNTIFYDEARPAQKAPEEEILEESRQDEYKEENRSKQIGALWSQRDGTISGKLQPNGKDGASEDIVLPENAQEILEQHGKCEITIKGIKARILHNKFKKTKKHPDYVIFRRE